MRRAFLLLSALVALAAPPTASGFAPIAWQEAALATAQRVWHPSCGQLEIQWASRDATPGVDGHTTGWAFTGDCHIYLPVEKFWIGYPELCEVVLHEGGHVDGLGHSDRGVMRPLGMVTKEQLLSPSGRLMVERWDGVDRRCLYHGRTFLRRRGAGPAKGVYRG